MERVAELEWGDGVGKALSTLGAQIAKQEKGRRSADEDYYADPHLLVQDLTTGATVLIQTQAHEGGKTHGRGYRRCAQVEQRVPSSLPVKKVMSRLLAMAIRNFVPKDSDPETYGAVVKKAVSDIAALMVDDSAWDAAETGHEAALNAALNEILGSTVKMRAGDTLLKVEAIPLEVATMDVSALQQENMQEVLE